MAPPAGRVVKVNLDQPSDLPTLYATNIVLQRTQHEFVITFYEARPPAFLGTPEELEAKLAAVQSVEARPLARIVVAASRMAEFQTVVNESVKAYAEEQLAMTREG